MSREEKKRLESEQRRHRRAVDALQQRIRQIENEIAGREQAMKDLETTMSSAGFFEDHATSKPVVDRHQALMWELGDVMHRWEELHAEAEQLQAARPR